jgi:IS1 transposase
VQPCGSAVRSQLLITRLLLERISLRGICRAVGIGLRWLLQFMGAQFQAAPEHLNVAPQRGTLAVIMQRLEAELDELWSFVGKKTNRHWVWIAMDATTRQVIAFHVGDRSSQSERSGFVEEASRSVSGARDVLYGSLCRVHECHSLRLTPHHLQADSHDQSRRTVQLHVATTHLAARACHVIVLQEARQS